MGKVTQDKAYREFFARQYLGLVHEDGDRFRAALERENAFYASTVSQLQLGKSCCLVSRHDTFD